MVELNINHNFIAGEGTLVDDGDWNDTHKVSGGGTLRVPQLIEEKTLPAGTISATFSGLNGDADGEYLLEFLLKSADGKKQKLYLAGDTTDANYDGIDWGAWTGGGFNNELTTPYFNNYESTVNMEYVGKCLIQAKTGSFRTMRFEGMGFGSNANLPIPRYTMLQWENTSTNITQLSIVHEDADNGFSGVIRLYRMVDLVLE